MRRALGSRLRGAFEVPVYRATTAPHVELPPGTVAENERGTFFLRTLRYPVGHVHGSISLGSGLVADRTRLLELARDARLEGFDPHRCLFLDTETTGLSGGAGTIVFLTGLGFFEAGDFVVEQAFLRSFADEAAALTHVANRLHERPTLVTFVGKAFDRHRLSSRMAVVAVRSQVLTARHLDLYYLARRAWRAELPDVRLQTLERYKLSLCRSCDLPGAEAPAAFLDWLRDGSGAVDRVFEHNRLDVLSLAALLGRLSAP